VSRLVIVGASLAGLRAAQGARNGGHEGELVVVGEELHRPYTRPPLSKELLTTAEHTVDDHLFPSADLDVHWRLGECATALDPRAHTVTLGDHALDYDRLIVATGCRARPWSGPGAELDGVHTIREVGDAIALRDALTSGSPQLLIVGAGFIGCEVAASARTLGVDVTLCDVAPLPMPALGDLVGERTARLQREHGVDLRLGQSITALVGDGRVEAVELADGTRLDADVVLVATGRRPSTDGLGLADLGVALTDRGQVEVDARWTTSVPGIYAIGDATPGPMLAHKGEDEGMAVAETIAGQHGHVNYGVIPSVIYTSPEVAAVGETEETLKEKGRAYRIGKFPFQGNARAKSYFMAEGFVKMLADAETDRVLGCHIIGPQAGELIAEVCVAMEFGAAAEDIARTCHAHPTCSEAVREAALACGDGAIHA
jgi:dihydrolipoamide dehydrogenase